MKILTMKDRIKLTINKVTFTLKPLNVMEMAEVNSHKKIEAGDLVLDLLMQAFTYLKFSLKDVSGIETASGEEYKLEFEGDYLTDDCASELFSLNLGAEFYHIVQSLKQNHIPEKLTYIGTEKEIKGATLEIIPMGGSAK